MVQFQDYDRITDCLMYLNDKITLNFTVVLSRKGKDGSKQFFHYETEYASKYYGTNKNRAIKRNMSFYFTLDNRNDFGNGFILKPQDVIMLNMLIDQQVLPWFFGDKRIFNVIENRLVITGQWQEKGYTQSEYKYISFAPIVNEYEDGSFKEGVRLTLNHKSEFVDMDIDKFMNLVYILKNTDMYSAACSLTTYVKQAPYGLNTYSATGLGGGNVPEQQNWDTNDNTNNKQYGLGSNNFLNGAKSKN